MNHPPLAPPKPSRATSSSRSTSPASGRPVSASQSPQYAQDLLSFAPEHEIVESEEQYLQGRRFQLRSSRFRGAQVPTRNITPARSIWSPISYDEDSPAGLSSSPLARETGRYPRSSRSYNDLGVLQEISNSSLRRRKSHGPGQSLAENGDVNDYNAEHEGLTQSTKSLGTVWDGSQYVSPMSVENFSSQQENIRPRSIRGLRKSNTFAKRSVSGESSRYIEHLESQLASLQTQMSAFTSPSEMQSQAAKLRALNSETRLLRQEVTEWEQRFNDRLREQMEHHNFVLKNLRDYISKLEGEAELSRERIRELEEDEEDRLKSLEGLEIANQDLERRLECMSELLAASPGRLDLYADPQSSKSALRPPVRSSMIALGSHPALSPLRSHAQWGSKRNSVAMTSPLSPTRDFRHRYHGSISIDTTASTEPDSDVSEQTLVNSLSPVSRRQSWLLPNLTEGETRQRPVRRMRKFHVGSTGPRSLILPTTNHRRGHPSSAPVTTTSVIPFAHNDEGQNARSALRVETDLDNILNSHTTSGAETQNLPDFEHSTMSPEQQNRLEDYNSSLVRSAAKSIRATSHNLSPSNRNLMEELSLLKSSEHDSRPPSRSSINSAASIRTLKHMDMPSTTRNTSGAGSISFEYEEDRDEKITKTKQAIKSISQSLDLYVLRARQTCQTVWVSTQLTLHRPMIEFRMWLVRILLGDMARRGIIGPGSVLRVLHERRGMHKRNRSTGNTIGLGIAPATASKGLLSSRTVPEFTVGSGRLGLLGGIVDHIGDDLSDEEEDLIVDYDINVDELRRDSQVTEVPQAPAVAWLKFSMTMIVAVGIAIKDGPSSLFVPVGMSVPGQSTKW